MQYRLRWEEWLVGVVLALSLAVLTTFVSNDLGSRATNRADTIENQSRLLRGEPFLFGDEELFIAPHYNRVLIPLLLRAGVNTNTLPVAAWYLLIRLATAFLAFFAFWWCSIQLTGSGLKGSIIGAMLLGYGFIITFNYYIEYPIDFLEVAFFAVFVLLAVRKHYYGLLLLAVLGALNRESAAFVSILWFLLYGVGSRWRVQPFEVVRSVLLAIMPYAVVLGMRVFIAGGQALQNTQWLSVPSGWLLEKTLNPADPFNSFYLALSVGALLGIWLYVNRTHLDPTMRRLLLASVIIALVSTVFGFFYELRIYLPTITIAAMVAAGVENKVSRTTVTAP